MAESSRVVDWSHFVRLWIAIAWTIGLALYCSFENNRYFFFSANAGDHTATYSDTIPVCCESYHVEVAQEGSEEWARWEIFRKMESPVKPTDDILKDRPWQVLHSQTIDRGFPVERTHYLVTIVPVSGQGFSRAPDTATYGPLAWILGAIFVLSGVYVFLVFIWSRAAANVPIAAIILVLVLVSAQIWITYIQGGLVASPVGGSFTTISAFLVAHAVTATDSSTPFRRKFLYFLPSAVLPLGSMIAHYFAVRAYSESAMLALQQIHKKQYIWFLLFSLLFGIASLGSRRIEKLRHQLLISSS